MKHVAILMGLSLTAAFAESEYVVRAKETLARIKDQRTQRGVEPAPASATWGHHLKEPDPIEDIKAETPVNAIPRPDLRPSGTISVWGGLKVVVGSQAYGVGEEIYPHWRVKAILGKKLYIEHDPRKIVHDYVIP